jgi:hypothetical protein
MILARSGHPPDAVVAARGPTGRDVDRVARDAFWQYPREIVYERRVRPALFRLDIDHVLILFIRAHLAQELLKLPTAFLTHFALKLSKRFIYRLRRGR